VLAPLCPSLHRRQHPRRHRRHHVPLQELAASENNTREEDLVMVVSLRSMLLLALAVVCAVSLLWMFSERRADRIVMADGAMTDIHQMNPETLEHEIRSGLPIGSSLTMVDEYLKKRGIEFSFEAPTKTLYATARKLKGSTMLSSKSLTLKFYFDDASKLKSIDAKVSYTGP
jgi:hypothetical protein